MFEGIPQLEVLFPPLKTTGKHTCYSSANSQFSLLPPLGCVVRGGDGRVVCVILEEEIA